MNSFIKSLLRTERQRRAICSRYTRYTREYTSQEILRVHTLFLLTMGGYNQNKRKISNVLRVSPRLGDRIRNARLEQKCIQTVFPKIKIKLFQVEADTWPETIRPWFFSVFKFFWTSLLKRIPRECMLCGIYETKRYRNSHSRQTTWSKSSSQDSVFSWK